MVAKKKQKEQKEQKQKECFIIMPIREVVDGYPDGHFKRVYEDIIIPACDLAKFTPVRADDIKKTNLIHVEILIRLINSPLAICDLSTGNPNVLFELGIRQAFDKPVVVIQDSETPLIFDTALLRHLEYSKEMQYHDVCYIQKELKEAIEETVSAESEESNSNSIIKLLKLHSPAEIPNNPSQSGQEADVMMLHREMRRTQVMIESLVDTNNRQQVQQKTDYGYYMSARRRQRMRELSNKHKIDISSGHIKLSSEEDE